MASTSVAVVLATVGPLIYRVAQQKAEDLILAEQRRYQKILMDAASGMTKQHDLDRLLKLIVHIIKKTVKVKFAAIFLNNKAQQCYELREIRDTNVLLHGICISSASELINKIVKRNEPFLFDELLVEEKTLADFPEKPSLIVPSYFLNEPIGFLLLGEKANGRLFSQDDINVFKTLASQAALAVENCIFMEEFKRNQERLFNAEKLAAIGGMADGVAHQIKNRLYEFSIVSQEMELDIADVKEKLSASLSGDPELAEKLDYLTTCTQTLVNNVKKTNGIIQGILNFARTEQNSTAFTRFSLKEIIQQAVDLVKMKHEVAQFPLVLDIPGDDVVFGVKGQIQECVYNCLDNAYEAIREKIDFRLTDAEKTTYIPEVRIRVLTAGGQSTIDIIDNGVGIKDENKPKIFSAFFTTKASSKSGSGIGSYVVKRMVEENHHGRIKFTSTYMQGTALTIILPFK